MEQREVLRATVLRTARRVIRDDGFAGLTIRKLADELDCSPMTLYGFFKDKHALLVLLANEIFEDLTRGVECDFARDPLENLKDGCMRYVRFGLENPEEYRIIFMTPGATGSGSVPTEQALLERSPAFAVKVRRVQACVDAGIFRGNAFAAATILWTLLHGLTSLLIACPTFPFGRVDSYVDRIIEFALHGLALVDVHPLTPQER